jgi:hypothetical protein
LLPHANTYNDYSGLDPDRLQLETQLGYEWLSLAYGDISYVKLNLTTGGIAAIPAMITTIDIQTQPVAFGELDWGWNNAIDMCLWRVQGDGIVACELLPGEPQVLLDWMVVEKHRREKKAEADAAAAVAAAAGTPPTAPTAAT